MGKRNPKNLPECFLCSAFRRHLHPFDFEGRDLPVLLCEPCLDRLQLMSLVAVVREADPRLTHEEATVEVLARLDELTADLNAL